MRRGELSGSLVYLSWQSHAHQGGKVVVAPMAIAAWEAVSSDAKNE